MNDETFAALSAALYRQREHTASPRTRARIDAQRDALRADWLRGVPDGDRIRRAVELWNFNRGPLGAADMLEVSFRTPAGTSEGGRHPDDPPLVRKVGGRE